MNDAETGLLARHPWVPRRPLTVDDYYRMAEAGILGEDDRTELIEGELVAMTPIGTDHSGTVNALSYLLIRALGERAVVSTQNPVRLSEYTEPQPDVAVLKPRPDFYRKKRVAPEDVLLLTEIAQSSVAYDRSVKLPLYARHGIREYWLVRLDTGTVEVYRGPGPDGYGVLRQVGPGEVLGIEGLPDAAVAASAVLGV